MRQLDRQIGSQFYERTALSKDKAAMRQRARRAEAREDIPSGRMITIKDPYVLEFLNLRTSIPESDLEVA